MNAYEYDRPGLYFPKHTRLNKIPINHFSENVYPWQGEYEDRGVTVDNK